ncbi:MAG: glycosyltransferase family 4 protein [Planctomycetes bacterium]|nr:glycosyltransferase family 4 protein [Planctomycetota bacterium]
MKLGIVAPEFPPTIGGMQAVASGFARQLMRLCDVFVLAHRSEHSYAESYPVFPVLSRRIDQDRDYMRTYNPDAWLFMNAGYAPLANELDQPCFVYCHGVDFLKPWCMRNEYVNLLPRLSKNAITRRFAGAYRRFMVWRDMRIGLRSVKLAFVNSNPMRERLVRRYWLHFDRTSVIHPAVEECFFQVRSPRTMDTFRILTVARLQTNIQRKNIDGALRAVARIDDIPIEYTIVGDGSDRLRLERLADELGLASRVRFRGALDREDLLACFRESDLFLLAPRQRWNDVEGFGIVYVEASASGLPVLASRCGGITDAVRPGVTGELLLRADARTIETGIRMMWKNRDMYQEDKIREFAHRFRWETTAAALYNHVQAKIQC